jgi:hypothetical protein
MKKLLLFLLLIVGYRFCYGQSESVKFKSKQLKFDGLGQSELKGQFIKNDFAPLWLHTENQYVYGFIGNDYQRLKLKFLSVIKDSLSQNTYDVLGKSMVRNNIVGFHGKIKITNVRKFVTMSLGVDDELKGKGLKGQFMIVGDYLFAEDATNSNSGVFKGKFRTDFYLDKNKKVYYDDIEMYSDGYTNNEFVGQWASYNDSKLIKRCNWGDYRIPNSGDFDIGAGEFSPNDKYLKYGWKNLRDVSLTGLPGKKAQQIESLTWWK